MEQLVRLQPTAGKPFRIVLGEEAVDGPLVLRKPVRPEIEAHQLACCPQLVFEPLVSGCRSVLDPLGQGGLAATGMPILAGLLGLLLIGTGSLVYRRSRRMS